MIKITNTCFIFNKDIDDLNVAFKKGINRTEIRGFATKGGIFVNLSAEQWKLIEFEQLPKKLSDTIIHETIHYLLIDVDTDFEGEEKVCQLMAGQIELKGDSNE